MNLYHLLIFVLILDAVFAALAIWCYRVVHRLRKGYSWQISAADAANRNYRKGRQTLLEANKDLQDQLEAAEKKWGEADTQCKWHEREMELFLQNYKQLEERENSHLSLLRTANNNLTVLREENANLRIQLHDSNARMVEIQNENLFLKSQKPDPHAFPM